MKKLIVSAWLLSVAISAGMMAQEVKENKVKPDYLPVAGDFAVGADVTPVLTYLGNLFSNAGNNTLDMSSPVLYGKYYLTDMSALRVVFLTDLNTSNDRYYVRDDEAWYVDPLENAQVIDVVKQKTNDFFVSVAYQKYIGKKRLRGFYGGQVLGGFYSDKVEYVYGNPMSELNPTPTIAPGIGYVSGARPLERMNTKNFETGLGLVAGFEYYILPKVCIGGELSVNAVLRKSGQLYSRSEKMEGDERVQIDKALDPGSSSFKLESFRFSPAPVDKHMGLYVMFHF